MTKWFQLARHNPARVFLYLALVSGNALAENPRISYSPVPDWVRPVGWVADTNWSSISNSAGTRCLLYEAQERPRKAEEYVRVVELMENENGVQDSGSLRFSFNPEFQELCLHRVAVHRAGKTIACLNPSKVRIIQPEPDLDGHVFTGRQTAVLFVEDLRVGDVLEYAYTIRGANPILGGHYASRFIIQSETPAERELFRVVWDDRTPLYQRLHLTEAPPAIKPWGEGREYTWDFTNLPAIPFEDYQPASCEPYPYVEVSDFADWRSVVDWALPLYNASPTNLPSELRALVGHWQSSVPSNDEKARLALEFVQDNLRYTGIELGPDSYRPADPVETFQKRFGDCKGKVVLLRFLLQQMNIESYPALVNSAIHEAIESRLPSPFVFNHVILQIRLDGKIVWVDPTRSHQGGPLWNRYLPPYGKALVICPGNNALEDVPRSRPECAWQQRVTSTFVIKGYKQPVSFTVRTEYLGASADEMREEIAGTPPNDRAKDYLNYYVRLYPGITGGPPLKITDNRPANLLAVEESYTITNLWARDEAAKLWKACLYADNLYNTLTDPKTRLRKFPLALAYPLLRQQEVIVHLPDRDWQITDLGTNIEHDAFSFSYHRQFHGSTVKFNYECRTRLASVPVELIPGYLTRLDRMEDLLTDTLQRSDEDSATGINWLMVVTAMFGAGATVAGGVWYWRRLNANRAAPPPLLITGGPLQGLKGWLFLVGLGLCLAPFVRMVTIGQNWEGYFSIQVWQNFAMPRGASYHPFYGPLLIFELLGNIFLFGLNLLVLGLFFTKRRAFSGHYMGLILYNAIFLILDDVGCALIPSIAATATGRSHVDAIRATIFAVVWCLYMVKSRRVKATFIN
jgi:hypothetical protein